MIDRRLFLGLDEQIGDAFVTALCCLSQCGRRRVVGRFALIVGHDVSQLIDDTSQRLSKPRRGTNGENQQQTNCSSEHGDATSKAEIDRGQLSARRVVNLPLLGIVPRSNARGVNQSYSPSAKALSLAR
jgi:hypothetical protein